MPNSVFELSTVGCTTATSKFCWATVPSLAVAVTVIFELPVNVLGSETLQHGVLARGDWQRLSSMVIGAAISPVC